jgi:hypothetical protein
MNGLAAKELGAAVVEVVRRQQRRVSGCTEAGVAAAGFAAAASVAQAKRAIASVELIFVVNFLGLMVAPCARRLPRRPPPRRPPHTRPARLFYKVGASP